MKNSTLTYVKGHFKVEIMRIGIASERFTEMFLARNRLKAGRSPKDSIIN